MRFENLFHFGTVVFERIDLPMEELALNKKVASFILFSDCRAQTQKRKVFREASQPVFDVLAADRDAVFPADQVGGLLNRVQGIVERQRINDDPEGKGFVLGNKRGKFLVTMAAVIKLHGAEFILPKTFSGDVAGAAAIRTGGDRPGFMQGFI